MISLKTNDIAICAETATSTVRTYCDQGFLGPVPRSQISRYRSYDPRLIPQIYLVRALRDMGLTNQQLKDYSEHRSPQQTAAMYRRCSASLRNQMAEMQIRLDMLQSYISLIEEGQSAKPGAIEVRALPERPVQLSYIDAIGSKRKDAEQLCRAHSQIRQKGNAGCPLGFAYSDFYDFLENPDQPAQFVSYDPNGPDARAAGEYLVGVEKGYYDQMNGLPKRMFNYALQHNLALCGPAYVTYLHDTASVSDAEQYLVQIAVSVKREACRG